MELKTEMTRKLVSAFTLASKHYSSNGGVDPSRMSRGSTPGNGVGQFAKASAYFRSKGGAILRRELVVFAQFGTTLATFELGNDIVAALLLRSRHNNNQHEERKDGDQKPGWPHLGASRWMVVSGLVMVWLKASRSLES